MDVHFRVFGVVDVVNRQAVLPPVRAPHFAARVYLLNTAALNLGEVISWIMTVLMPDISTVLRTLSTAGLR